VAEQIKGETGLKPQSVHLYDVIEAIKQNRQDATHELNRKGTPAGKISIAEMLKNVNENELESVCRQRAGQNKNFKIGGK